MRTSAGEMGLNHRKENFLELVRLRVWSYAVEIQPAVLSVLQGGVLVENTNNEKGFICPTQVVAARRVQRENLKEVNCRHK